MARDEATETCWTEVQEDGSGNLNVFRESVDRGADIFYSDPEGRNMLMLCTISDCTVSLLP